MITSIHQSHLNSFLSCGEAFRRRYIEGHIMPPGIAMGRGTGVHRAAELNERHKMDHGKPLPLSDISDITRDAYMKSFENGVYLIKEDQSRMKQLLNEGLNDSLRCSEVYLAAVSPHLKPIEVEKKFEIEVPGVTLPLAGRIDLDEHHKLGDLKTATKTWPAGRADEEIQPTFYSYAHEAITGIRPEWDYHILIARRGKYGPTSQDYQPIHKIITDRDYRALKAKLQVFEEALKKGVFIPALPTAWSCSEKWCNFYKSCKMVGN